MKLALGFLVFIRFATTASLEGFHMYHSNPTLGGYSTWLVISVDIHRDVSHEVVFTLYTQLQKLSEQLLTKNKMKYRDWWAIKCTFWLLQVQSALNEEIISILRTCVAVTTEAC